MRWVAVLERPARQRRQLDRQPAVAGSVDEGRDHQGDFCFVAETLPRFEDGEVDFAVRRFGAKGVDFGLHVVVVDGVGFEHALRAVVEERRAARVDVGDGLGGGDALLDAGEDGFHAGEVVCCRGVEDDVGLRGVFGDQVVVVEVADDGGGAGLAKVGGVRFAAHQARYLVAFADEEVQDGPADEARADDEDVFAC